MNRIGIWYCANYFIFLCIKNQFLAGLESMTTLYYNSFTLCQKKLCLHLTPPIFLTWFPPSHLFTHFSFSNFTLKSKHVVMQIDNVGHGYGMGNVIRRGVGWHSFVVILTRVLWAFRCNTDMFSSLNMSIELESFHNKLEKKLNK